MQTTARPTLPTWALALVVPVVAALVALVTLNVTSDDSGSAGAAEPRNGTLVTIKNFTFTPTPLRVRAGTTVTVVNDDGTTHTLTADDGAFDTRPLDGGAQKTITIDRPGTYVYHCQIHPSMTGVIEAT